MVLGSAGMISPTKMCADDVKTGFLGGCFRVLLGEVGIPEVALTLHPRLRALGLKPSAFNLSGWILSHADKRITNGDANNRGNAAF